MKVIHRNLWRTVIANGILSKSRGLLQRVSVFVLITLTSLFSFSISSLAQGSMSVSLSPLAIELAGQRGDTVPFSVSIVNNSTFGYARFKVYSMGLSEDRSGRYEAVDPEQGINDASAWVTFETDTFEVAPGQLYDLRGAVSIPRNAGASGYATVVMELIPEDRRGDAALSVEIVQRFVTALEIVVGTRHVRSAHIESMTVIPASSVPQYRATYGDNAVVFVGTLVNDGDVHVAGKGTLIIRDERGRRLREVPLGGGRGVVLPGSVVDFASVLGGFSPGKYEMQAIIDYGGSRPAIGRMEFELTDEAVGVSNIVAGRAVRIDAGPGQLLYDFPRFGYRVQTITVLNRDTVDVDFTVHLEEFANDEGGDPIRLDPGVVMPYSAVAWGDVRPATFTLRPGQRRNVIVGFRVPEGEAGGRYARVRIEGTSTAATPGMESATSEVLVDALLMLGTDFSPYVDIADLDWQWLHEQRRLAVGATLTNVGDIHGQAGMRLSLLEFVPEIEEEVGDFIVVQSERWNVVDAVHIDPSEVVLLPTEQRYMLGVFGHPLEFDRQYQVIVEALGDGGTRNASESLVFWVDADGNIHEGMAEHLMGADEA